MDDPRNIEELIMDNGLPTNKPVTLKDVEQINKDKHHKNMQNRMHRIDDSYQIPGEKPMSTADKPTSKFMDAMTQVLANEAEIMEKKEAKPDFLDMDGDGDEKEPMKKAIKDKRIKKEEVESVDEVAKAYSLSGRPLSDKKAEIIRKARMDRAVADEQRKNDAMKAKKEKENARESYEPLDELSDDALTKYGQYALSNKLKRQSDLMPGEKTSRQIENRKKGMERQLKKQGIWNPSTKEEVEHLDELKKSTLSSYIKKASGVGGGSNKSLTTLAAATGRHSERSQVASKAGDIDSMRKERDKADKSFDKSWNRRKGIGMAADKLAKEEVEVTEAATVLLRKGGATKRMRYNPATIERLKREGWVVASEAFVDKVRALFDIAEEISFEDALSLVEAVDEVKRGRGRPKKAVDPNAAPKREWKPGGRGRPPKNKEAVTKVSTSDTKAAAPAASKAAVDATDTGHILDHLRKAVSTNGTNSFRQKNGSTAKVSRDAALSLLTHHDKLPKASDRFQMQQHLSKSPEHLQNAIKNVNAGKPYNAGYEAKAKAKVSLAAPGWNDKK